MPHGLEVGYRSFTINGRMLAHGELIRARQGERVLFHNPDGGSVLWIGTAESSAITDVRRAVLGGILNA